MKDNKFNISSKLYSPFYHVSNEIILHKLFLAY